MLHALCDLQGQLDGDRKSNRHIADPGPEIGPAPLFPANVFRDYVGQAVVDLDSVRACDERMLLDSEPYRRLSSEGIPHLKVGRVAILDGLQSAGKVKLMVEGA